MRDTLNFLMYDWLGIETLTRRERYAEHTREAFDSVLDMSERMADAQFAPCNRLADTEEPRFDGERVILPSAVQRAVTMYAKSGLLAAGHDYQDGGSQLPYVVDMAANTFFAMANIGASAFGLLTYANCNLLMSHGSAEQKDAFARPELEGRFFGTMCLSEPDAGSSLGDIRTRAVPDGPAFERDPLGPRYRVTGHKMWISGGEHDIGENIVHLVLAKIPDEGGRLVPGARGLSLFIVPRRLVEVGGSVTDVRNDVSLAGLNHKLGYRAIPNTILNFGERTGAIGYRVGEQGRGLSLMFHMMNEARINVGMGATMLGYAGYLASLRYARERKQGRALSTTSKDASSDPIPIIMHADVKRMLLAQKAYCEGGLALALYCAKLVDERRTGIEAERDEAGLLLELLTPIAKSWPSEWCLEANSLAIQVHGGYGYTRDFPVEQHWRDNRLNMIHEGTHGVQALDLLGRKVLLEGGRALKLWQQRVQDTIERASRFPELGQQVESLSEALRRVLDATRAAWTSGDPQQALPNATPYMQAFGHVVVAWLWLDVAIASSGATNPATDFNRGKIQAARYFFHYELPKVDAWLRVVESCEATCRDMADAWF